MRATAWLLFIFVFGVGILLSGQIGPAWDEPDNMYSGGVYGQYITGGFDRTLFDNPEARRSLWNDTIYPLDRFLAHLPPVHNYVGLFAVWVRTLMGAPSTAANIIIAYHWSAAFFFGLMVAFVYRFARLLGLSPRLSLIGAITAYLYPTLFGHGYSNTKDIAQASVFIMSLYYLVRSSLSSRPTSRDPSVLKTWIPGQARNDIIVGAVMWGLGLATKFNVIYVPIIWLFSSRKRKNVIVLCIGLATALLIWPYMWFDPTGRIGEMLRYFTTVGQGYRVFWNGVMYQVGVGHVLWWYPWANLLLATPLPLLFLGVIGVIREIREKRWILLIWFIVPTLRAFLPNAAFYDGLRHFLEILPAWILLAVIGLEKIGTLGHLRNLGNLLGVILIIQMVWINVVYFPYSTGYLNFLAKGANERFDRDIEALSVKEGVDYLHKKFGSIRLWSPIGGHLSWYYLTPSDQYVYSAPEADSIILINKSSHIKEKEFFALLAETYVLDHTISRGNAIFAWVYRKK